MSSTLLIRPLRPEDISEVLALQASVYPPAYHEAGAAFLSRLAYGRGLPVLARDGGGKMVGYLFAHPWHRGGVPALGRLLPDCGAADRLFVHDLTVAPASQGGRVGYRLLATLLAQANALGLAEVGLVAVAGAAGYWSCLGFVPDTGAGALVGYGDGAVSMRGALATVRRIVLDKVAG